MSPVKHDIAKTTIAKSFGKAARTYDQFANVQATAGARLLECIDREVGSKQALLDLGCGTGRLTHEAFKRFETEQFLACDLAEGMIQFAQENFAKEIHWLVADAESLPYENEQFDLVYSNFALQWCDLELVLEEVSRILKPGGQFWFTDLIDGTLKEVKSVFETIDHNQHVNQFRTSGEVNELLTEGSWSVQFNQTETFKDVFSDFTSLAKSLKRIGAHNMNANRGRGLHGRGYLEKLNLAFNQIKNDEGHIPATYAVQTIGLIKEN